MANHGTVRREIMEYADAGCRIVVCELADGWHVVETYASDERGTRCIDRRVFEALSEAREYARGAAWTTGA